MKKNKDKEQVKQYYSWPAYTDNYHVMTVVDGKIEDDHIVSLYALSEIHSYLECRGYKKAHLVLEEEIRLQKAEQELKEAQEALAMAKAAPLNLSNEDAMSHHFLSIYLNKLKGDYI